MRILEIPFAPPNDLFGAFAQDAGAVLLESAGDTPNARYSYMACEPLSILDNVELSTHDGSDAFTVAEQLWREFGARHINNLHDEMPVPFTGGIIGYFGYELANALEKLPAPKPDLLSLPQIHLGFYDTILALDHYARRGWIISHAANADLKIARWQQKIARHTPAPLKPLPALDWQPELSRYDVENNIDRVIDYIHAGDIFQANYTQRFSVARPPGVDPYAIYRHLHKASAAPFAAFLRCGTHTIASASPERFVSLSRDGTVLTEPIKGTRPRGFTDSEDAQLAAELVASEKDRAENLMIVDLMRNDLSRVCEIGSVRVPQLCALETFTSVHHLVSRVTAQLRADKNAFDLLRATFPGGSITGAPKIRAMEIIQELEPAPRGVYCGTLGWIGMDGAMDLSMIIRTLTVTADHIVAQAGGGITSDSNASDEYDEAMTKLEPLLLNRTESLPAQRGGMAG